jgi:hypothetical protein
MTTTLFGKHLDNGLRTRGIKRLELDEAGIISETHLSEVINHRKGLSREKLEGIAAYLKMPVALLTDGTDYQERNGAEQPILFCPNQDCPSAHWEKVTFEYTVCTGHSNLNTFNIYIETPYEPRLRTTSAIFTQKNQTKHN